MPSDFTFVETRGQQHVSVYDNRKAFGVAIALIAAVSCTPAVASDWYVDGIYGSDQNDGSQQHPFQNWQHILANTQLLQPGDTVHFLPSTTYADVYVHISGTHGAPITIAGDPRTLTNFEGNGNNAAITIKAKYINVKYLNILNVPGDRAAISVDDSHHVVVTNNIACHAGGSGIQVTFSDYVRVSRNIVCYNGGYSLGGFHGSGISMWEDRDIDKNTSVKMIISNNYVYGNSNARAPGDTDGNGIIIDDNKHTQTNHVPYHGITKISNNIVFGNGGRGIHVYYSDYVIILGNSTFHNNQDPFLQDVNPGEIDSYSCGHVVIIDNIMFSDGAPRSPGKGNNTDLKIMNCADGKVTTAANLGYNDSADQSKYAYYAGSPYIVQSTSFPDLWADPRYTVPTVDPNLTNLQIQQGSPALKAGESSFGYPRHDILGQRRTPPITIGAYEDPSQ